MAMYDYRMAGTAAGGQTWETDGTFEVEPGAFSTLMELAILNTFTKLTQGRAVFGHPGVGCRGPYRIKSLTITEKEK